jgi:hypothetical protein
MSIASQFWWVILSSMVSIVLIITYWEKIRWFALNFRYSFPLIGKTARLSRDDTRDNTRPGWLKSERTLCADYAQFIGIKSEEEFNRYNSYLERAGDIGRKPLPGLMWLLITAMVVVEALGFSYVLAGYTIPGASEAMQSYGAMGIAFLISVLLVFLTHHTGSELYLNSKVQEARTEWKDAGKKSPLTIKGSVSLANNHEDDSNPHYTQMAHRVGKQTKLTISLLTAIFVISVAIGATYVRGVVLEKELTQEVSGAQINYYGLPEELASVAGAAEEQAREDTKELDKKGGWTTFIILAVIFIFLQILGVILGYKYGFAGKQSKEAYKGLGKGKFHTYDDVRQHKDEISDAAQSKLETLQQKMEEINSYSGNEGIVTNKTFETYLLEKAEDKYTINQKHQAIGQHIAEPTVAPVLETVAQTVETNTADIETNDTLSEIDRLKAELAKVQQAKQEANEIAELKRQIEEAKQA